MLNKKWSKESHLFVHHKEHFCPLCNQKLIVESVKKIVNSKSPEAKDFDFSCAGGDGYMFGDVEFSYEIFYCPTCNNEFSIRQIRIFERNKEKYEKEFKSPVKSMDDFKNLIEVELRHSDKLNPWRMLFFLFNGCAGLIWSNLISFVIICAGLFLIFAILDIRHLHMLIKVSGCFVISILFQMLCYCLNVIYL